MVGDAWSDPVWLRALTLDERVGLLGGETGPPADPELAGRRLRRWRSQPPFAGDSEALTRRLAAAGLSETSFLRLLGEPEAGLAERAGERPAWLATLADAFSSPSSAVYPEPPVAEEVRPHLGFLNVVRPLLDHGFFRLREGVRELSEGRSDLPWEAGTVADLFSASVVHSLALLLGRTMVLELDLAAREGRLAGETPESRFESFTESLRNPETALGLLRQYPVLARQAVETVERWVATSLEVLRRLRDDACAIRSAFSPDREPGPLATFEGGLGDSHRGGRSVALLTFASGLRLIYKPRSVGVEAAFQRLLAWTAEKGFAPAFRCLRIVEGEDHGWVEWVEAAPCADREGLERFYRRQGGYLALLYLLAATDFHSENLIAAGEHPVLVDLEALFHPWSEELGREPGDARPGRPLFESVLQSGMLPMRIWQSEGDASGIDLSGLAAPAAQVVAQPALMSEKAGTDAMRYVRRSVEMRLGGGRPTLDGGEVQLCDFLDPLLDGFSDLYRLLVRHRDELAAPGGPLAAFAGAEVRVIVRQTRTYAMLFVEAQHPFLLGHGLDRDRLLDRLWEVADRPGFAPVVAAERRDLQRGDVPIFTARPGSRDLWTAAGERLPGLLAVAGLDEARSRLARLGEDDLRRQSRTIHDAVEATVLRDPLRPPPASWDGDAVEAPARDEVLEAARRVALHLEELALRGPGEAWWLGIQTRGASSHWSLGVAGPDLHLGMPGILLFLAYLGDVTGEERWTGLARDGAATLCRWLEQTPRPPLPVGAFGGWGGTVYTLVHLAALWDEPELLDRAEAVVSFLPELIDRDEMHDVVAGAAGCLVCLLRLWERRPSPATLAAAVRCGERLLERAVPAGPGIGWILDLAGPDPLAGMSHGAAGIAWALLQLEEATGDAGEDRFRRAALAALAYERSLFDAERRNWPDLRAGSAGPNGEPHFMSAWCHGAPGIALARLDGLDRLDDATVRDEIAAALATTLAEGFGRGHCQCHGDLGNLEALNLAEERLGLDLGPERARRLAATLADIRAHGWRYGLPGRTEPPGFMVGLAGIGYGLLRQAAPRRVPPVLVLARPAPQDFNAVRDEPVTVSCKETV
ncbi:MAG: type 2 lanthipeptide synthetase LanM family protein [Acidobacteriota bacterium]